MTDPYQSIKNTIKLPNKRNVISQKKLFPPLDKQKENDLHQLSEPLLQKTNDLLSQLNQSFQIFQNPSNFYFTFPKSMFPDVQRGERNQITYEQKIITEQQNTFKNKLSDQQLDQIAEKGQFKVKSNIQYVTLPYIWKINQTLFWGRQKVQLVWKNSLAKIYGIISIAKTKLFSYVPKQLNKIRQIPKLLFSILFGRKSLRVSVQVYYQKEIFKDFWKKIIENHYIQSEQWASALWNYLYVYYDPQLARPLEYSNNATINEQRQQQRNKLVQKQAQLTQASLAKQNKIRSVHIKFNQQWNKLKKKVIIQISDEVAALNNSLQNKPQSQQQLFVNKKQSNNSDDKVLNMLAEKKFTLYIEHMKNQLPKDNVPLDVINAIVMILRLFKVINSKYQEKNKRIEKKRKEIEESIKKKHPIKSIYRPFFDKLFQQEFSVISKAINEEFYIKLQNDHDFTSLLNQHQKNAYKQFTKLRLNYQILEEAKKKQLPQLHSPTRTFISNHRLLPPYKIIQSGGYYTLKKVSDDLKVDTTTNFWKLKLYWMRIKTWSINYLIGLLYIVWSGPTGLRCLYGVKDFGYDMEINYQTGEIYYNERRTVIGTFLKVLEGMKNSRRHFQELPDLGLLGKNISRYFNYIECYVFRLVFVGIIITLIGYPCLIIVASTLSAIFLLTVWAWMPVILILTYLFNIFIYQFQTAVIPDRFVVRSIPIIKIIYEIIKAIIITLLLILNLIILAPLKIIFIFLFCTIQRGFRTLTDKILVFLFRKVGRTPSRDTSIARKISGPGMSKEFYMSINEQDVYVIVQSQLERIYMLKFDHIIREQMHQNQRKANQIMKIVLQSLSSNNNYYSLQYINENYSTLIRNYGEQYIQHMARYPNNPYRVRFTQQEIDNYFENTVNIVKNFVVKYEIQKWIFQKYDLYEDMYDQLTRSIWAQIFNCGEQIFEPLEKLDSRFKLQDQYNNQDGFNYSMKQNVGKVMRSLQGQVSLHANTHKVTPWKHSLLTRQQNFEEINYVFNLLHQNYITNVDLNLQSIQTLFVPNLNIANIIIIGRERRERQIKNNPDIVDL